MRCFVSILVIGACLAEQAAAQDMHTIGLSRASWFAMASFTEYVTSPVEILGRNGPSPAFVPTWRRNRGVAIALGWEFDRKHKLMLTGTWDRSPLGYALDLRPEDHPELGLRNGIYDASIGYWFPRASIGVGYHYGFSIGSRSIFRIGVSMLYNLGMKDIPYRSGVAAIDDSTTYWIMGIDARMFPRNILWRMRGEMQYEFAITKQHGLLLGYYYDRPMNNTVVAGEAVILGNTVYRTTIQFLQSGERHGLLIGYQFKW